MSAKWEITKLFFFVLQTQIRRRVKDWRIKAYFLEENIPNMLGPRYLEIYPLAFSVWNILNSCTFLENEVW